MLRNLLSKFPVIANTTEHGVSSGCSARTFRNVSPLRKPRSNSNSKCSRSDCSFTAIPQARRSLSYPRSGRNGLYDIVDLRSFDGSNKLLDRTHRGFCYSRDYEDEEAVQRSQEHQSRKQAENRNMEGAPNYYESNEQYELEACQPRPNRNPRTGSFIEELRQRELMVSEKRSLTDALQPANQRPFGSQDTMFFVSLFKPSLFKRSSGFPAEHVDVTEENEASNPVSSRAPTSNQPQNRKYSTAVPKLFLPPGTENLEVKTKPNAFKVSIPSKTSLQEKRKSQIEDYIYQRYKPNEKRTIAPQSSSDPKTIITRLNDIKSIALKPKVVKSEININVNSAPTTPPQRSASQEIFLKAFGTNSTQKKSGEPEILLPATRNLCRMFHLCSRSQTVLSEAAKNAIPAPNITNLRGFGRVGHDPCCEDVCKKKRKKPARISLEPEKCVPPDHTPKKILMPSKVRLKVPPCLVRPNYDCPPVRKCPPRADDCMVPCYKPLPDLVPKPCECVPDIVPKEAPKLKRLNLKVEQPPKPPCIIPPCQTPRADDNLKPKVKKLPVYEAKDCPCIDPPKMTNVNFKRLGPCKVPEVCKPPRICPPPPPCIRADDGLKVTPKCLPFLEAKPCPCIDDPPLKDVRLRRLDLKVPEKKRYCPEPPPCLRADDNYVLKPKKLRPIEAGLCPCIDRPMKDVNFKRLECKDIEYKCIVPDPCKVTPRADWGCWEYEAWECNEVDPECIEPPPCPPPKPPARHPCYRKDHCKNTGTRDILGSIKQGTREFNTDSTHHTDNNMVLKLFKQVKRNSESPLSPSRVETSLKTRRSVDSVGRGETNLKGRRSIDSVSLSKTTKKKSSVGAIKKCASVNVLGNKQIKGKKVEEKNLSPPATLKLLQKLADLEKKQSNPLLFQNAKDIKPNMSKNQNAAAPNKKPEISKSAINVAATRMISMQKSGSAGSKGECRGKVTPHNARYSRSIPAAPPGARSTHCEARAAPTNSEECHPRCPHAKKGIVICCEKQDAPYPSFSEATYGEVMPFTNTTRWRYDGATQRGSRATPLTPGFGSSLGGRREYSTINTKPPQSAFSSNNNSDKIRDAGKVCRRKCMPKAQKCHKASKELAEQKARNPHKCSVHVPVHPRRNMNCPVFKLANCPVYERLPICEEPKYKGCGPRPKTPFPAFSDILTEELADSLHAPLDKKHYQEIQPKFMKPLNTFPLPDPTFPKNKRVHHDWEIECLGLREVNKFDDCYKDSDDFFKEFLDKTAAEEKEHEAKKKFAKKKQYTNYPEPMHFPKRYLSTAARNVNSVQKRNFSSIENASKPEQKKSMVDYCTRNVLGISRRVYIRNYKFFCKNPGTCHEDIDLRIKELADKHSCNPVTTCKLVKLRNASSRVESFNNKYQRLNKYKNVPSSIKRFFNHSKNKYKLHPSPKRTFCSAAKHTNNTVTQDFNALDYAMLRTLSTNMSLAKSKSAPDVSSKPADKMCKKGKKFELKKKPPPPSPSTEKLNKAPDCKPKKLAADISSVKKADSCPKFRLKDCPEKTERVCHVSTPKPCVVPPKQKSPYQSFSECNTTNIFPNPNTECPFIRSNMKEVLQPQFPIIPETPLASHYPTVHELDAHYELDYIRHRLGIKTLGISQDCESFGTCVRLPRCIEFEVLIEKPPTKDCGKRPDGCIGTGCDPGFTIKPCGSKTQFSRSPPKKQAGKKCDKGNFSSATPSPSDQSNILGVSRPPEEPSDDKLPPFRKANDVSERNSHGKLQFKETPQKYSTVCDIALQPTNNNRPRLAMTAPLAKSSSSLKYIDMQVNNDEDNLCQSDKNKQLQDIAFECHDCYFTHPISNTLPEKFLYTKEDSENCISGYNNSITCNDHLTYVCTLKDDVKNEYTPKVDIDLLCTPKEYEPQVKTATVKANGEVVPVIDNQKAGTVEFVSPKFSTGKPQDSWLQNLRKYFYASDCKGYHGYLQIPTCIAEDENNTAVCDLPKSLIEYKEKKQRKSGISYKKPYKMRKGDLCCSANEAVYEKFAKRKLKKISSEPTVYYDEKQVKNDLQHSTALSCQDPSENRTALSCEVKKPKFQPIRKKSTSGGFRGTRHSVQTFSETCIKIQQTKTEEIPVVRATSATDACLPKPNESEESKLQSALPEGPKDPSPSDCPPPPQAPPAPPSDPCKPKKQPSAAEVLLTKIVNYFKARPDCPPPEEWKKKALKTKAQKAAHAAGLVVIDPKMLPPEMQECICNGKLDIEMCKEVCECDVDESCEPQKNKSEGTRSGEVAKSFKRAAGFDKCKPISCGNKVDFAKLCKEKRLSTMIQTRFYSRNFTSKNLEEINRMLEEEELKKKRNKWLEDLYNVESQCPELTIRNLDNRQKDDDDLKKNNSLKRLKVSKNGRLVKNNEMTVCHMNEFFGSVPSRENILQKVLQISMSDFQRKARMDLYNLMVEQSMDSNMNLSIEEWDTLKTRDVLRALDALLKKNMSEED